MMAIMLRQLGLGPGHRVLEVGTGAGYNAALIAYLVGNQESVVTIDVIPELIEQARGNLTAAGGGPGPVAQADRTRSGNGRRAPCDQRNTGHARRQSSRGRHRVIEQHTEDPVAPSGAVLDSIAMARTRTSGSLRQHRPGQRLWVLLHAQFLLRGPATSGDDIRLVEDDYQRMAVLRREGHG